MNDPADKAQQILEQALLALQNTIESTKSSDTEVAELKAQYEEAMELVEYWTARCSEAEAKLEAIKGII